MKQAILGVCIFALSVFAFVPKPALAADHCNVKVESVDENRALSGLRPIWNASLFDVTLLAKETMPSTASLRVYTLGGEYWGSADRLHWYTTGLSGVYRSSPIALAFPRDETFLHAGVTSFNDNEGAHDCVPRLFGAFAIAPRLTLAPLRREGAVAMRPTHAAARVAHSDPRCPGTPVRIERHASMTLAPPAGAPAVGGPFVSLISVHVSKSGAVQKSAVEASSGLPWLDSQTEASAVQQGYRPATVGCRPVPGVYYFASRFDTPGEDDLTHAF